MDKGGKFVHLNNTPPTQFMKLKSLLLTVLVLFGGCSKSKDSVTPVAQEVWFFGDSITVGLGATVPTNRWTSKLAKAKDWVEHNQGVNGETLIQASETTGYGTFFERYKYDLPKKPAGGKYVFISYGANDCNFNFPDYTTALFSTQLQTIITFANSQGWANNNIVVLCGYFENDASWTGGTMARYNSFISAAQTVAQNNAGVYFVNPFNTYDATELSDHLHPNDAGYAAIAAYVAVQTP